MLKFMAALFPKRTFWEKLGRKIAQGWEKARDASSRLRRRIALKLDHKNARDRLVGRLAADRFLNHGDSALDPSDPALQGLLEEILAADRFLDDAESLAPSDPALKALLEEVRAARAALAALETRLKECRDPKTAKKAAPDG